MKLQYKIPTDSDGNFIANPIWTDLKMDRIEIDVIFDHIDPINPVRFTCAEKDGGWEHSEEIFARAKSGEFGELPEPVAQVKTVCRKETFVAAMMELGMITEDQAMAWVTSNTIPEPINTFVPAVAGLAKLTVLAALNKPTFVLTDQPFAAIIDGMTKAKKKAFYAELAKET